MDYNKTVNFRQLLYSQKRLFWSFVYFDSLPVGEIHNLLKF